MLLWSVIQVFLAFSFSTELDKNVTYFGAEPDITNFSKKLEADKGPVTVDIIYDELNTSQQEIQRGLMTLVILVYLTSH